MSEIAIRSIQHYMYCPHRWGLLEIDKAWAENVFVTKANLMHKRVHDPAQYHAVKGRKVFTSVPVYNDREEYDLYGVTDCLELRVSEDGVAIDGSDQKYAIQIVEYKPTRPKNADYHEEDLMQVFAQKVCVDSVFQCDCEAAIYYADTKKRILLPFRENYKEYDDRLKQLLTEMRNNLKMGTIPPIRKGQKCSGCSMKDICMPSMKKIKKLKRTILEINQAAL